MKALYKIPFKMNTKKKNIAVTRDMSADYEAIATAEKVARISHEPVTIARAWRESEDELERVKAQRDELLKALKNIQDCAYNPDQVAEVNDAPIGEWIGQGNFALGKFASRIYSVARAAIAKAEGKQ